MFDSRSKAVSNRPWRPYAGLIGATILVVTGASSVFELAMCQIPTVFVPYPYAADEHQRHNAEPLERSGAAIIIEDAELTRRLPEVLKSLIEDRARRTEMSAKMKEWVKPDAADRAAEIIVEVSKKKERAEALLAQARGIA